MANGISAIATAKDVFNKSTMTRFLMYFESFTRKYQQSQSKHLTTDVRIIKQNLIINTLRLKTFVKVNIQRNMYFWN